MPQKRLQVARFPHERMGDAELVQAAVRGDDQAAGLVWDRYSALVRSVVRGALGPDSSAEDLVQEVFVAFLRCAADIRDGNSLRAFLASIATRKVIVELRRRHVRRWVTLTAAGELPDECVLPDDFSGREILRGLYRILDHMSNRRRMAFVLRHVQTLEISEVASALGISESTAKREIARATKTIKIRSRTEPALLQYLDSLEGGAHA
jgi:RNA polymerase sigma-70 factor, ECF subfamily